VGRYYSRIDGDLYIYVTMNDPMVDLSLFPPELDLLDPAKPRKIKEKMAIITGAAEANADKAEIILSLNGFKKRDYERETLEHYYIHGDESVFEGDYPWEENAVPKEAEKTAEVERMDVIIPRATSPTLGYSSNNHEGAKDEPGEPPGKTRKPQEPSGVDHEADQDRRPASEEELIDSLVLWMRSQGIQIEKERGPPEIEPPRRARDERHAGDKLVELLSEALRAETPPRPTPSSESSIDELLRQMAKYVESITPRPQEEERPKTALDELLEQLNELSKSHARPLEKKRQEKRLEELLEDLTQLVRSRTPAPVEDEKPRSSADELITQISEYLRRQDAGTTPATLRRYSIEEELDRHIVEYVKSRIPIREPGVADSRRIPSNELQTQLTMLRRSEQTSPLKIERKAGFPEELVELLSERLKRKDQEK
jgi:hypothetical protein